MMNVLVLLFLLLALANIAVALLTTHYWEQALRVAGFRTAFQMVGVLIAFSAAFLIGT